MYLKSIELNGFKSFAKKSDFNFSTSITSIVGPNGSGKSNVAEAFRFVLGEQSFKSMRGKKGEDLIWNGSGNDARANRASVKLVFDNRKKIFNIDFSEVSIERVVHRDGINDYFLNGSRVRLKDIVELLLSAHIGASGHHIISQGEADRILSANAEERKGMIEEALGLRLYQYKRTESEKKLEKTFENIAQVESLRREIAPHLKFLKKQVEKFELAENMRTQLIALAKEYFKREEIHLSSNQALLDGERDPLNKSLEKLHKELAQAKSVLEKTSKAGDKASEILHLEKELNAVRSDKANLVRELGRMEGEIAALSTVEKEKTIDLKEVEGLYEEITLFSDIKAILKRVKEFISARKEAGSNERLVKLKERQRDFESQLEGVESKESFLVREVETNKKKLEEEKDSSHDAERAVFRIMSQENEIISKLNILKAREEALRLEDEEYKRELKEVGHIAGTEALKFKDLEVKQESDRSQQEERKREIQKLKIRLEDTGAHGMDEVMKEFKDTTERDEFLARELLDLDKSAEALKELIKDLEERLSTEFSAGIEKINKEFEKLFVAMFGGGEAKLILTKERKPTDLEDEEPEVEEGLEIAVNLPRKKIRSLMMLSGGERALTSIALIFAISQVNPPPFVILDETDAALDEANSKKYGDMVEVLAKHSQLILITHNRETMSRAGMIYGVTMGSTGGSKLLSISLERAVEVAK